MGPKTAIIIPAYNESNNLPSLLESLQSYKGNVFFVDDCSTDSSASIIRRQGFKCLRNTVREGVSETIVKGLLFAISKGFEYAITLDADGQHNPKHIPSFLKNVEEGFYVCGNRFNDLQSFPTNKIVSNCFASKLVKKYLHVNIPDVACGFRAFKISDYTDRLDSFRGYTDFELIYDYLFYSITQNVRIKTVDVSAIYYPNKLWDTGKKEILSLLQALYVYTPDPDIENLLCQINSNTYFEAEVDGTLFHFHYIESFDSYIIEANISEVLNYYGNF